MQPFLLRTLSWLSHTSAATPGAAGASAAPSGTMPCSRVPRSVTQATLRLSELQHAAGRNKLLWRPSLRRHATLVAQHVGMAVPRFSRDTRSCRSVGSTIGRAARRAGATLTEAAEAETERAAARNKCPKPLWRPSLKRHATLVAQHVGMAVPRFSHNTSSCRSVGSTIRHDAMLTGATLRESSRQR